MTTLPSITLKEVCAGIDGFEKFEDRSIPEHFNRGMATARSMEYITIGVNNVWGGRSNCGGSVGSYEKIGYHAGSISFIVGAYAVGIPIFVYRDEDNGLVKYQLYASNP